MSVLKAEDKVTDATPESPAEVGEAAGHTARVLPLGTDIWFLIVHHVCLTGVNIPQSFMDVD